MSVIAVISTKGGAGKSTVAVHLSVAAALKKRRPLIIDFDKKQLSILLWARGLRKKAKTPAIQKGTLDTLLEEIKAAKRKYDLIIIDVGAGGGDEVREIAAIADFILIPVRASAFDISGTRNTIELLRTVADNTEPEEIAYRNALGKAAIVLNCAPVRQTAKWRAELDEALDTCGAGSIGIIGTLGQRDAYSTSIEHGLGVTESAEDDAAVAEILDLYRGLVDLETDRDRKLKRVRRIK